MTGLSSGVHQELRIGVTCLLTSLSSKVHKELRIGVTGLVSFPKYIKN